jgi:hypothetical protein
MVAHEMPDLTEIRKLFALSKSISINEAAIAVEKAQALMRLC